MGLGVDELRGRPPRIERTPVTGRVTKVDAQGVWVVPVGGDLRVPLGPCRGPSDIPVGTVVMVIYTQERPWVFGAELITALNADGRDLALLAAAAADAQTLLEAHAADTTEVHGIADTSALETQTGAQAKADQAETNANDYTDTQVAAVGGGLGQHANDTTDVHGIPDTAQLLADVEAATAATHDTGRRLVAAAGDVTDLPDLELLLRRRGDVVTVWTREAATTATHAGATTLATLPDGVRPDPDYALGLVVDETGADLATQLRVAAAGQVVLTAVSGARHHGHVTFTTSDPWPAVLPGTEDS